MMLKIKMPLGNKPALYASHTSGSRRVVYLSRHMPKKQRIPLLDLMYNPNVIMQEVFL